MKTLVTALLFCVVLPALSVAEEVIVNAVGDVMLAGRWTALFKEKGYDFPFERMRGELAVADITMANLECPIGEGGEEFVNKTFRFRAAPPMATAVAGAGISIVTLANNHIMDFGNGALTETIAHLDAAGVAWTGAGRNLAEARRPVIREVKGKRVAFLAYSQTQPVEFFAGRGRPGTAPASEQVFSRDIAAARKEADYVIVSFHWGKEGSTETGSNQRTAARRAVDAGADVVIGHHPHVLQGVERYGNGIIFYSLGNFAFASKGKTGRHGAMVRLRLNGSSRKAEILPVGLQDSRTPFQPQPLDRDRSERVIRELNRLSEPFTTTIANTDGRYWIAF